MRNDPPLPIDDHLSSIVAAVGEGNVVVRATPGAGKTTRVPPALWTGVGRVVLLEPRRVAARAAAQRIASAWGTRVGEGVGLITRGQREVGAKTRLVVATEGSLLRRLLSDPLIEDTAVVCLDEVHERTLEGDLTLALLREIQREVRPDLRLVAMSATVDTAPFAAFLDATTVDVPGLLHPVELRYDRHDDTAPVAERAARAAREAWSSGGGSVLVFLPGAREIADAAAALADLPAVPLHGSLPPAAQDAALRGSRRIVLATNVAETSVTVEGVDTVIDGGLVRRLQVDPSTGLSGLITAPTSRASSDQRAGRAGRLGPGRCWRLFTEAGWRARPPADPPAVATDDLAGAWLDLLAWGAAPRAFGWFERPPERSLDAADALLHTLGALNQGKITPLGRRLSALGVHPRLGRLVLACHAEGATYEGAWAAALLSDRDPLRANAGPTADSDLAERVRAAMAGRATTEQRQQADRLATRARSTGPAGPPADADAALARAVLAAWPDRVARRRAPGSPRFRVVGGRGAVTGPQTAVRDAEFVVAYDLDDADKEAIIRGASAVEPEWLPTEATTEATFEPGAGRVEGRRRHRYGDLVVREAVVSVDGAVAEAALAKGLAANFDAVAGDGVATWRARLAFAARFADGLPEWSEDLRIAILLDACIGQRDRTGLAKADWDRAVRRALGGAAGVVERIAPRAWTTPRGRTVTLSWPDDANIPTAAVRIQDLLGVSRGPTVADGRVRVRLELLAPNGRPAATTDDLERFWRLTWPDVRKALRGRYPRHAWPEDPLVGPV